MNDPAPRKRLSGLKIFSIVAGILALLAVIGVFWMKIAADRRREALDREMKAEIAALRARSGARPVPAGPATPGNAWLDYDQALAEYEKITVGARTETILDANHQDKPDGALAKLPKFASPIARLRAGARRSESKKDYDWEKGGAAAMPPYRASYEIVSFLLLEARVHAKEGRLTEAAGEILDAAQYGCDLGSDGPIISHMIGMNSVVMAAQEIKDLLDADGLDHPSRELLGRGLRTLEAGLPGFEDALLRERLFSDSVIIKETSDNLLTALIYLNSIQRTREWIQRTAAASRVSWAELLKVDAEVRAEAAKAWNPITKMMSPSLGQSAGKASRGARARVALLRVALQFQETGAVLDLDDPYGTKLKTTVTGDTLKVWSVGPDGVDNGGSGGWKATDGPDMVLEVKRK